MKVLLIRPNSQMLVKMIPLGLGYIAQALRMARKDEIQILDARNLRLTNEQVAEKIRDFGPDVVGLSAMSAESPYAHEYAEIVKANAPKARVVMGGPYVSASREAVLRDPHVDAGVVGEGEITIVELLNEFEGNGDLSEVAGIVYRDNGEFRSSGPREFIRNLDDYMPAWDLLDPPSYFNLLSRTTHNKIQKSHRILPVFTSRGCPYNCIFCHNVFGKTFRPRTPDSVVEELKMLKDRYRIREFEILDDSFNISQKRVAETCSKMIDADINLPFSFPNGIRGDKVDTALIDLMKAAGLFRVSIAPETASPRLQKVIKKNMDVDAVKENITLFAERDVITMGFFIMGFPTETYEEMMMTANYAIESDLNLGLFFYLNPFPGTEVARLAGVNADELDLKNYTEITVNLSEATDEQMHSACKHAYRGFYMKPRRILTNLRVMPKNFYFFRNLLFTTSFLVKDSVKM